LIEPIINLDKIPYISMSTLIVYSNSGGSIAYALYYNSPNLKQCALAPPASLDTLQLEALYVDSVKNVFVY